MDQETYDKLAAEYRAALRAMEEVAITLEWAATTTAPSLQQHAYEARGALEAYKRGHLGYALNHR